MRMKIFTHYAVVIVHLKYITISMFTFKCKHCKEVSCVQSDNAIDFSIPGYFVENFEIEATGICKGCNVSFSQSIKKRP